MASPQHVVQLEAFESPLRGRRIRWFRTPTAPIQYPPGFQEQVFTESPPFQRRILITAPSSSEAWKLLDRWDVMLMPTISSDWSLTLTVILNQPQPALVIITPEVKVPAVFYQKAISPKQPTFIHIQDLTYPLPTALIQYDATVFPPLKNDDSLLETIQSLVTHSCSSETLRSFVLKDVVRDLKGAGATLVISSIDENSPQLYWIYAPDQHRKTNPLSQLIDVYVSRSQ